MFSTSTISNLSHVNRVILAGMVFLLSHMIFHAFSYVSLLLSVIIIYTSIFVSLFDKQATIMFNNLKSYAFQKFMMGGVVPSYNASLQHVHIDSKGNIIEGEKFEDDGDFDDVADVLDDILDEVADGVVDDGSDTS
jgi:uncharacterized membrane protein